MKYAIISDTHGNHFALQAVLADAKAQGADMYLLLGDYSSSFPWGNEVAETIRGLKNAVVIRGNGENYLADLKKKPDFIHEQFKPVYWAYQQLSAENLDYLLKLPETSTISDGDTNIHLNHSMDLFYRTPKIELFHSHNFRKMMEKEPFTHDEYLIRAKAALLSCAMEEIQALSKGIYLFGHNHMQFHMEHDGKIFINPGSCGEPLDCNTAAPYTLLTINKKDQTITPRRVKYDLNAAAKELDNSDFTKYAPMWSKIMKQELLTGKDYFMPFVIHLVETSRALKQTQYPVSNDVWDIAVKTWDAGEI